MTGQDLLNYLRDLRDQKGIILSELRVGVVADVEEGKGADLLDVVRISSGVGYIAIDTGIRPAPIEKKPEPKIITPDTKIALPESMKHLSKHEIKTLVAA